jgi:hypothetical protein
MNRILSLFGALCLLVSVPLSNSHAAPSDRLEAANASLRDELTRAMLEGAAEHGIEISTEGIVFATRDDGMVVNTGVANFDTITYDHLARGAVVGFTYYSGFTVEPGFYRTFVILPKGAKEGVGYLLDAQGRAVKEAKVTAGGTALGKGKWTGSISWNSATVDYHSDKVNVELTVSW